jgi:hypothetical protein
MRFQIEIGGRVREVGIEPRRHGLAVTLDGEPIEVDVQPMDRGRFSLRFPATGQQHDVVVARGRDNSDVEVLVGGLRVPAEAG